MKISDPFCRVEKRKETDYRMFRESMESAGVKTKRELDLVSHRLRQKIWISLVVLVCLNLFCVLLFPASAPIIAVLSILVVLWLGTMALRASSFIHRYRQELG